jgi:hypothetical protein
MKDKIAHVVADISPDFLWGVLALAIFVFLIIAFILQYHWKHYGVDSDGRVFTRSLFWIVSIGLIITATLAIVAFES